jgi:pimeloyl-ACP methyl ester carboxylesterase
LGGASGRSRESTARDGMRRALGGAVAIAVAGAVIGLFVTAPAASAEPAHQRPQGPAKVRFGADFPKLVDHEWNFALGGFGGVGRGGARKHVPVIFVHGNNVDHADWYPVRDDFKVAGWTDQEMYGLSYNGLGANNGTALMRTNPERDAEHTEMGWDGLARITNDDANVPDLYDFILAVRAYTGSAKYSLVGHSLGVTLARKTLKVHPELRADLVAFVGIAGANHGTSFCPPGSEGNVVSCNEIAAGTPWLDELNGPGGSDETYAPAKWLTIYDGSGAGDPAFAGPTYAQSPVLKGGDNRTFPETYHNDLRLSAAIVTVYRTFLETAEASVLSSAAATPSPPSGSVFGAVDPEKRPRTAVGAGGVALPASGGAEPVGVAALVLLAGLVLRRRVAASR